MGYKIELHIQLTLSTAQPDEGSRKSGSAAFTLFKGGLESHVIKSRQGITKAMKLPLERWEARLNLLGSHLK